MSNDPCKCDCKADKCCKEKTCACCAKECCCS